ncbi:hypothetical protein T09_11930 [Trichinella sp. T9]|nr:hypothetical protein T09_11930 [Trichinella sp. T9]
MSLTTASNGSPPSVKRRRRCNKTLTESPTLRSKGPSQVTPSNGSMGCLSTANTFPNGLEPSLTELTRLDNTCDQLPGDEPKSKTSMPGLRIWKRSSISKSLNALRQR